jgi:SAM-dependent methyltransferase
MDRAQAQPRPSEERRVAHPRFHPLRQPAVWEDAGMPGSHYGSYYRDFAADVYAEIRRAEFGEDLGQNNWQTLAELEGFSSQLALGPGVRLLDVACGAGGPGLHLARLTGCEVTGVDREQTGLANGRRMAREAGLEARVRFVQADASQPLPFADGSFDAILCLDALNHLPGRMGVFTDWARLLAPAGRLLVTDPVTVTGLVAADELATRSSIGYFEFAPPGEDERLLTAAGLHVIAVDDLTETVAGVARQRCRARAERAPALRELEGDDGFERRQRFLDMVATLAAERRISRFAYLAEMPR